MKLWFALAAVLLLAACVSPEATAPVTTAGQERASPNTVTVTTSGSVEVGVGSSNR